MEQPLYKMSFNSRGLLRTESSAVAELYLEFHDWQAVKSRVSAENMLQLRTISAQDRTTNEIISRLKTLSEPELQLLVAGSSEDQADLLWLAICRKYQFIADFEIEVLRDQVAAMNYTVHYDDFDLFYARKAEWHHELDHLKAAYRDKLRQNLFKIMREADLIDAQNQIRSIALSPALRVLLTQATPRDLLLFPGLIL